MRTARRLWILIDDALNLWTSLLSLDYLNKSSSIGLLEFWWLSQLAINVNRESATWGLVNTSIWRGSLRKPLRNTLLRILFASKTLPHACSMFEWEPADRTVSRLASWAKLNTRYSTSENFKKNPLQFFLAGSYMFLSFSWSMVRYSHTQEESTLTTFFPTDGHTLDWTNTRVYSIPRGSLDPRCVELPHRQYLVKECSGRDPSIEFPLSLNQSAEFALVIENNCFLVLEFSGHQALLGTFSHSQITKSGIFRHFQAFSGTRGIICMIYHDFTWFSMISHDPVRAQEPRNSSTDGKN